MDNVMIEKLEKIESLLIQLNDKIDNYLGMEKVSIKEKKLIDEIKVEIENGEFKTFQKVFED